MNIMEVRQALFDSPVQGVVAFFPSFSYAGEVIAAWRRSDLWTELCARKHVFCEPRNAGEVETVLSDYAARIKETGCQDSSPSEHTSQRQKKGALLLCVVGGRLSEGINFGDGLGRCHADCQMPLTELEALRNSTPTELHVTGAS